MNISFRSITDEDLPFLQQLYGTTREDELAVVDWSQQQKDEFIAFQFTAQHKHYQQFFADAEYSLILLDNERIGRLYVDRREDEIRIVDIALMPEYRGQGIGGQIMRDILDEARRAGKPVGIHVERNNPAMHLYDRLGFQKLEDVGVYYLMKWSPDNE